MSYEQKYVAFFSSVFAISPATNAQALMRGRAAFVYHGLSVDKIGRTVGVLTARYFRAEVIDDREFFMHHIHSTPPLILIVSSRLDRVIQSATEMLPFKRGSGVAHSFNCNPTRLADALVFSYFGFRFTN